MSVGSVGSVGSGGSEKHYKVQPECGLRPPI